MSVAKAIEDADSLLPGKPARDGEVDPRWQAIIRIGDYVESNPEDVWEFVVRWGDHSQDDLRDAIACVLLEHLLEHHFDSIFPRVKRETASNLLFADMVCRCWRFGQSERPTNAVKFDELRTHHGRCSHS